MILHLWVCLHHANVAPTSGGVLFGVVGPPLWSSLISAARTDRMFNKKSKKLHKSSQRHVSLGIPTNIAVGSLGFRAELDIGPKGERGHDLEGARPDSSAMLDENDVKASRIVPNYRESEDQGLPVPGSSTSGAAVGRDDHNIGPILSERLVVPTIARCSRGYLYSIRQEKMSVKPEKKKASQWRRLGVRTNPMC